MQIICSIELESWRIDNLSHQYPDSVPISGFLKEQIGWRMSEPRSDINQLMMQVNYYIKI